MVRRSKHKLDFTVGFYEADYTLITWLMKELGYESRSQAILAAIDAYDRQSVALQGIIGGEDAKEGS